ncbi:MAG: redoxin domain-containing protein [Planctomycetaceae bacterium]|nr:redoxin domain-containing protein [Planctomycetaceae bacterium]
MFSCIFLAKLVGCALLCIATEERDPRVPQMLLPAIHSQEVQDALELEPADREWLESQFLELDGVWWRARLLPETERQQTVAEVESKLLERLSKKLTPKQIERLRQLVVQAQGTRALLRTDIAEVLKLSAEQRQQLSELATATVEIQQQVDAQRAAGGDLSELQKQWQEQQQKEQLESIRLLDTTQKKAWAQVAGELVDLTKAQRIYPMAPEFAESSKWLGKSPGLIKDMKGKVVVVHFYAFQCINCQRNFHHYNTWRDQWAGEDVVVVGIQTPETPAESNIDLVRQAIEKDQFRFPVIMDSDHANWKAWGNTMWPTVYVIDKRGYIRMWWQGELNWQGATGDQQVTKIVDQLLKE